MKSITYSRVSSEIKQDYERQLNDIREYCQKNKIELVGEFSEKESGRHRVRKELSKMLEFVKNEKIDFVIVHELSRLGRTNEVLHTVDKLNDLKVCLISLKENLRTLNPDKTINPTSNLVLGVMSSINSFELETFKFRSKSGLRNNAKNGKGTGSQHLPFGYTTDENNKIILDNEESQVVKQIFDLYISGWGCRKIAVYLNSQGILTKNSKPARGVYNTKKVEVTKKKWTEVVIFQILKNEFYTGKRKYMGELFDVPVLIDKSVQQKVKSILNSKVNYETMNKKYDFLLDDRLIVCGECGKYYYARKNKIEHRYQCRSKRGINEPCGNLGIQIEKLDKAVTNIILSFFPNFLFQKQDNTKIYQDLKMYEVLIENNENSITETEKKEKKLLDLYLSDSFDKSTLDERVNELKRNKERLNKEIELYTGKIDDLQSTLNRRKNYSEIMDNIKKNGITKTSMKEIVSKIVVSKSEEQLIENRTTNKTLKITVYVDEYFVSFLITQLSNKVKIIDYFDGKRRFGDVPLKSDKFSKIINDEDYFYELMGVK